MRKMRSKRRILEADAVDAVFSQTHPYAVLTKFGFLHLTLCWVLAQWVLGTSRYCRSSKIHRSLFIYSILLVVYKLQH